MVMCTQFFKYCVHSRLENYASTLQMVPKSTYQKHLPRNSHSLVKIRLIQSHLAYLGGPVMSQKSSNSQRNTSLVSWDLGLGSRV
jgi:hypothetical protein